MSAKVEGPLRKVSLALQLEKDGAIYFDRAHKLVDNPRLREAFRKFAESKREQLKNFEDGLKSLNISPQEMAEKAQPTSAYPLLEVQKAECYVCGHTVDIAMIPDSCPRCGASIHAFEKEMGFKKAKEITEAGSRAILTALGDAEKEADEKLKKVLTKQIQIEQQLLDKARKELESHKEI